MAVLEVAVVVVGDVEGAWEVAIEGA